MPDFQNIIAIDLGNSSGRVVLGQWNGSAGVLREIYRFPNAPKLEIIKGPSEATLIGNVAVQISALENSRSLEEVQAIAARLAFLETSP